MCQDSMVSNQGNMRRPVSWLLAGCGIIVGVLLVVFGAYLVEDGLYHAFFKDLKEVLIGTGSITLGAALATWMLHSVLLTRQDSTRRLCLRILFGLVLVFAVVEASRLALHPKPEWRFTPARETVAVVVHYGGRSQLVIIPKNVARPCHWYETGIRATFGSGDVTKEIKIPKKHVAAPGLRE
jgi:hypothetical protein